MHRQRQPVAAANKMMPSAHLYGGGGHHQQFPGQGDSAGWMHQQGQQPQQSQQPNAQQQYNRLANTAQPSINSLTGGAPAGGNQDGGAANADNVSEENRRTMNYIADLLNESTREAALLELSKKREQVPELALILWHSFGVMTSLLQEIISVYTLLNPSQLTAAASNRVCNALALLQCVASHNDTRTLFLHGESL